MNKSDKKFRLNLILGFSTNSSANARKTLLLQTLRNIACLYSLDLALDYQTYALCDTDKSLGMTSVLIHLRATDGCFWTYDEVKQTLKTIVDKENPLTHGVHLFFQTQRQIRRHPFPDHFYRPLNFPFAELHKGGEKTLIAFSVDLT